MTRSRPLRVLALVLVSASLWSLAPSGARAEAPVPPPLYAGDHTSIVALRSTWYGRYDQITHRDADDGVLTAAGDRSGVTAVFEGAGPGATLTLAPKAGEPLVAGPYEDVVDLLTPDPDHPRLHLTGFASTGCDLVQQRFDVLELAFRADGAIERMTVDTEQTCMQNANVTVRTRVRFHATDLFDPSPGPEDQDRDDVDSTVDNCPTWANPSQADADADGIGDTCDPETTTPPPAPGPATTVHRHAGPDRIETAIAAARSGGEPGSAAAVLARADGFADALAGTPLAAALDAPLLLTGPDALDPRVLTELRRALPEGGTVHLLGGEASIRPPIAQALTRAGFAVVRHAGADRYATAAAIASAVEAARGGTVDRILLATGTTFPDGLSAGAAAAAARGLLLLTHGATLPPATHAFLADHVGVPVTAVGGPAAAALPSAPNVVGADRYATAMGVAQALFPADVTTAGLASGAAFPDALSGGAHAARLGGPLLLTPGTGLAPAVLAFLGHHVIERVDVYGGPAVVAESVLGQLESEVATAPRPKAIVVPPVVPTPATPKLPVTLPGLPELPDPVGDVLEQIACVGDGSVRMEHPDGVYLVDADRGCARVALRGTAVGTPTFSPDGRYVILQYVHGTGPFAPWALWKVDLITGAGVQLTPPMDGLSSPKWSPDGEWIAYDAFGTTPYLPNPIQPGAGRLSNEIWLVRPDGSDRHRLMAVDQWGITSWSADGSRLAAVIRNEDHLAVADIDTGEVRYHSVPIDAYLASWSPDGSQLAFNARSDHDDEQYVYLMDPDTGAYEAIARRAQFPRWSPDGRWIAVSRDDHVVLLRPDGATGPTVTCCDLPLNWSDDGRYLLSTGGSVYDMTTGTERTLTWPGERGPWPQASRWIPGTHTFAVVSTTAGHYTP